MRVVFHLPIRRIVAKKEFQWKCGWRIIRELPSSDTEIADTLGAKQAKDTDTHTLAEGLTL